MRTLSFYKKGFMISGIYDLLLGGAFFLFYKWIYSTYNIEYPPTIAYIHLTAAFVFVQGIMYLLVSFNPIRNIDMVKAGIIYKAVYVLLCLYYYTIPGGLPHNMFLIWGVCDVCFLVFFVMFVKDHPALNRS